MVAPINASDGMLNQATDVADSTTDAGANGGTSLLDAGDTSTLREFQRILAESRQFEIERKKMENEEKKKKIVADANGKAAQWVT